jgi:hypothetical protein
MVTDTRTTEPKDSLGRRGQDFILDRLHLERCMMCGAVKQNVAGLKGTQCTNCGFYDSCC